MTAEVVNLELHKKLAEARRLDTLTIPVPAPSPKQPERARWPNGIDDLEF